MNCKVCDKSASATGAALSDLNCLGSGSPCNGMCMYTYAGGTTLSVKKT